MLKNVLPTLFELFVGKIQNIIAKELTTLKHIDNYLL